MRILIVSYNWPPRNAIGTLRPYSWAENWAKKGAQLWNTPPQRVLFTEACEDLASKLVLWVGQVHAWIGDHEAWDTEGVVGTSDVVLDLDYTVDDRDAVHLDVALRTRELLNWKSASSVPLPKEPEPEPEETGVCLGEVPGRPWLFQGHSVVKCDVGGPGHFLFIL